MDFHGMKRKDLQTLCKKHGIPANLKNTEMATRLASVFQKEIEEIVLETKMSPKDSLVVNRVAKKVTFSPENEIFEFTRSLKKHQRKTVNSRKQGPAQELRRSNRIAVAGSNGKSKTGIAETEKVCCSSDITEAHKVPRRSKRIGSNGSSTQEACKVIEMIDLEELEVKVISRRSTRLAAKIAKTCVEGGTSKAGTLLPAKRFKRPVGIDVQTDTQEDRRRSLRLRANTSKGCGKSDDRPLCSAKESKEERKINKQSQGSAAVNNQVSEVVKNKTKEEPLLEKAPKRSRKLGKSVRELLLVDGQAQKDMNLVDKETDGTLGSLVKSSKRVTRSMKRDRPAEPGMDIETASALGSFTPKELSDEQAQFDQEEAGGVNVEARGSSKKSKKMDQECLKNKPQGIIEGSPSSSETKAAESVLVIENVLDSTLESSVGVSQRTNTLDLNSERMEGECEDKLERDTVLMAMTEEKKEQVSSLLIERLSPASVQLAVSSPGAELVVPTGHILLKDESTKTKDETLIWTPRSDLKEHNSEAKLAKVEATLEKSAASCNEIHSSKDDVKGSLEKEIQAENLHGNFSECSAEEQADVCEVGRISLGHCVDLEMMDEVSPMEENVSECVKEDGMKALSQPTTINKAASSILDESAVFITPERRNLMLMEQENGKRSAAESVESHAVVFTTPEKVSLLADSGLDEVGKEEEHTATDLYGEPDVLNTAERLNLMLGGSRKNEARNEGESAVVELHEESNIATSPLRQPSSVGDFKGDGIEKKEENRTFELHCESGTCISPNRDAHLGNSESDGAENSGGKKARELFEESLVFTGLEEGHELSGYSGQDKVREGEVKMAAQFYEEGGIDNIEKSGFFTSLERQLLSGDSEQKKAEKGAAEFNDECVVPNFPERHPFLEEAAKSEENKAVELQVDCDIFAGAEKHLSFETDEGTKGDNIIAKCLEMSDVLTASESHSLIGDFEPNDAENKYRENKDVVFTAATCEESFGFTSPERNQFLGNSEPHTVGNQKQKEVEFKDESAFFTRLESRLLLGESGYDRLGHGKSGSSQYQSHHASSPEVDLKDDGVVRESHDAALDFKENIIADSSGSIIASKVSSSHEFIAGEETAGAEFTPKGSQAANVVGLDAIHVTSKQSGGNAPHVELVNLSEFDIEGEDTIMDAVNLALPDEGDSETIGEISSHLEVAGTCSMVLEESTLSTDIQNQVNVALEELAVTDNNETNELTGEKVTKNLDSSVSEKTCVIGGTDDEHLGCVSEVELKNTCEKSEGKFRRDEATGPIATAFEKDISMDLDEFTLHNHRNEEEKAISLAPDEITIQDNRNEKAADEEMISREATPRQEETLNESSANIDETEKQVRRDDPIIYRTEVKPKRPDLKENAPNAKILDNLNVTAPRASKRQPLQDLRKN